MLISPPCSNPCPTFIVILPAFVTALSPVYTVTPPDEAIDELLPKRRLPLETVGSLPLAPVIISMPPPTVAPFPPFKTTDPPSCSTLSPAIKRMSPPLPPADSPAYREIPPADPVLDFPVLILTLPEDSVAKPDFKLIEPLFIPSDVFNIIEPEFPCSL